MADSPSSPGSRRPGSKPSPKPGKGQSKMGFLGRKIGPVPIWLIGLGIFGVYYWYTHYGPGKPKPKQQQGQGRRPKGGGRTRVIIIRDDDRRHRRHKPHPRGGTMQAAPRGGGNVGGGMTAMATNPTLPAGEAAQLEPGGPVAPDGGPVYAAYQQYYGAQAQGGDGADQPVPEPSQAYAPMTAGAIYG